MWVIIHFVPQLYGHDVTVLTDHTAVKAMLQTPNPSGKHARWSLFVIEDDMLCYEDPKQKHLKRVAVPRHLQ